MGPLVALLFLAIATAQPSPDVEVRLTDGSSPMEGRLEVFHQGHWGTVCDDDSFDMPEAAIVCRQLGYSYALQVKSFGPGTGTVVLDKLNCNGNEAGIMECYHGVFGTSRCDHIKDAGVVCSDVAATEDPVTQNPLVEALFNNGKFRLVGGPDPYQGRVEIFLFESKFRHDWMPMCATGWSFTRALFVCYKLGYRPATSFGRGRYASGTGQIANCSDAAFEDGGEYNTNWDLCVVINATDAVGDCAHDMGPDVVCSGKEPGKQNHIRLVEGSNNTRGRVELYDQNVWKGFCFADWTMSEAQVVCRQLGLPPPLEITPGGTFGSSNGNDILQTKLDCTGQEYSLITCPQSPRLAPCTSGDAAVACGTSQEVSEFDLQLVGGSNPGEGRVEMLFQGQWSTMCQSSFGEHEATVACRQVGFQYYDRIMSFGKGQGTIVTVSGVNCNGNEARLVDCFHRGTRETSCVDSTLGLICSNIYVPKPSFYVGVSQDIIDQHNNGKLRLVGGPDPYEGRVEVFVYAQRAWVSMCGGDWNSDRAVTVCQKLDYRPATSFGTGRQGYGEGTGPIVTCHLGKYGWLDVTDCQVVTSDHPSLNCSHDEDPYVVCSGTESGIEYDLRLVNGSEPTEGRVEIYHLNMWKVVCADDVGLEEARAICQGLVYPYPSETLPGGFFGNSEKYDVLEYVIKCSESDARYRFCPRTPRDTPCLGGHAAVRCGNWTNAAEGDVRLSGGHSAHEGRVQIHHNGQWGYVCKNDWNYQIANVVCRQLGYLAYRLIYSTARSIKRGSLTWSPEISCSGLENNITECDVTLGEPATCYSTEQVRCDPRPYAESFKARLAGGPYPNQGRVELLYQGVWGTVCDDAWDKADAEVICRQLGFPSAVVALDGETTNKLYGYGSGDIFIGTVACEGTEDNIIKCQQWYKHMTYCGRYEAAGAMCFSEDYPSEDPTPKKEKDPDDSDNGLSGSQTRNIILGVLIGTKLLAFLCWLCYKCFLKSSNEPEVVVVTPTTHAETAPGYQPVNSDGNSPPPSYEDATKSPGQDGVGGQNDANTAV